MPPNAPLESAIYSFEALLPELDSPPIAARRALDHAGLRLTIDGWRSLPREERERVTALGATERVDVDTVALILRRAVPAPQRVSVVLDPDPSSPPDALVRALESVCTVQAKRWSRLRSIDRYALSHSYRRAVARSSFSGLAEVAEAVFASSLRPTSAPAPATIPPSSYRSAGFYSNVNSSADVRDQVRPPPFEASATPVPPSTPPSRDTAMADVARKPKTERHSVASGSVKLRGDVLARVVEGKASFAEIVTTARVSAIMAAKRTHELLPLAHPVALTHLEVTIEPNLQASCIDVRVLADAFDRTGVELEALFAVSVACLTLYDMLKAVDRDIVVSEVKLLEKTGGRSGNYRRVVDPRS